MVASKTNLDIYPYNSDLYLCSIKMHEQRKTKQKNDDKTPEGAVPAYLLDREGQSRAKVLSNMIKQKRKEKAVSVSSLATSSSVVVKQHLIYSFYSNILIKIGEDAMDLSTQMCNVFCRASGRCPCPKYVPRERQKCSK